MDINTEISKLKRGCLEIISEGELRKKLEKSKQESRPLNIKAGFDPTAPDIHLGHTVLLTKLRQFQDLGHIVYFLIGDFTALIGDPSGQDKTRPRLTKQQIKINATTYKNQVFKILNPKRTKIVFNSNWLSKLDSFALLDLCSHMTVAQLLTRADFHERYTSRKDISLLEFLYPLLQAYDSVYLKADVEIGGNDQRFNLLLAREFQKDFSQESQVIMMLPLLEGLDGINKMSKSLGNYIGINDAPNEMFGKLMSVSDELMYRYYELLTCEDLNKVKGIHPKEAKLNLGEIIVRQYYGEEVARNERNNFLNVFSKKEVPENIPVYKLSNEDKNIIDIIMDTSLAKSRNEARRLIKQKAISFNNERVENEDFLITSEGILKIGPRRFLKIIK